MAKRDRGRIEFPIVRCVMKLSTLFVSAIISLCFLSIPLQAHAQEGRSSACAGKDAAKYVAGGRECLVFKAFGVETGGDSPILIMFLHGDVSAGGPASYMYKYAEQYARPGVVSVAVLRPSYFDTEGNKSTDGDHSFSFDSYTPGNIESVAEVVRGLKERYRAKRVILIGHSGGAAYVGVILGKYPNLASNAILAACPCDIGAWRNERGGRGWSFSLSPHSFARDIPQGTRVIAVSGEMDSAVNPRIPKKYIERLTERGIKAEYREIPGGSHGFGSIGNSAVFSGALDSLINEETR